MTSLSAVPGSPAHQVRQLRCLAGLDLLGNEALTRK
jgi:hypothetical protein